MKNLPEKDGDLGPSFEFPYLGPGEILMVLRAYSDVIGFFDGEHTSGFVTPTKDLWAMPDANRALLNVIP